MKPIQVCVVGLGRAGKFHLSAIAALDSLQLHSVVDTDAQVLQDIAAAYGCPGFATIEEALSDTTLDAVIVASPTDAHYDYIQQSLQAGKHVFTEKPLGHSLEEIEQCFDLAAAKGLALYLGFQRRYDKSFMALKESLPRLGDCRLLKASSRDNPQPSLAYLKISNNIFHDMLIHDFDILTFLMGTQVPTTVYAKGYAYDKDIAAIPDYDTVLVSIAYPGGLLCSIDTSRISAYGYDQRLEVFGELGMARVENQLDNTLQLATADGMQQSVANHSFPQRYAAAYREEIKCFAEGIAAGELNNVSKKECVLAHLIADAALESARSGVAVAFAEVYGPKVEAC